MAAWAAAAPYIIGAVGGILGSMGQNKAAKAQNAYMKWLYNPARISSAGSQLNPGAWGASQQQGYKQAWQNIGQNPGYIDPANRSYAMMQNDRGWQSAMQRLQGMIGRSGGQGGVAQAHTLASLGAAGMGRARIAQQFALWQENQHRQDLQMIANQNAQAQATAAGLAANQGQSYTQPTPWQTTAGNAITGGLAAWGAYGGQGGGQPQYNQQTPTSPSLGPNINAGNWYNWRG